MFTQLERGCDVPKVVKKVLNKLIILNSTKESTIKKVLKKVLKLKNTKKNTLRAL